MAPKIPRIERLVLHAGVQKTGSSFIQRSLRQLRTPLGKRGVVYVGRQDTHRLKGRLSWAAYSKGKGTGRRFGRGLVELVESRIAETNRPKTVLYSNESMIGRFGPEFGDPWWPRADSAMRQLIGWLSPDVTEIIVYVRRQDHLLESMYMQQVSKGHFLPWEEFVDRACLDTRLRFGDLVGVLESLPTVDQVHVKAFETIRSGPVPFLADFLGALGSADLVHKVRNLDASNPSFSKPAYEAAMLLAPLIEDRVQARILRNALKEAFPEGVYPKARPMSDQLRAEIIGRYASENEAFFKEYLPEYPADSYSSIEIPSELSTALVEGA